MLNDLINSPKVQHLLARLQVLLGNNIQASYIHGSAVTSGLAPNSDIDLFVIVKNTLDDQTRKSLITAFLSLSGEMGNLEGKRALEIIIFTLDAVFEQTSPVTCDFIYGEWLREEFLKGEISQPFQDFEMTLLLAQIAEEAQLLQGIDYMKDAPKISLKNIIKAIKKLAPTLIEQRLVDTRNVLLTLARMVRTCEIHDFISKKEAADYVIPRLSSRASAIMMLAKEEYLTGERILWEKWQQDILLTTNELYSIIESVDLTP